MKGFKTETKHIGGFTYQVTQLDAITGRKAFTRLMKVIGPAIGKLQGAGGEDASLGQAFAELTGNLSEEDVDYFCDVFAKQTAVSGGDLREGAEPQLSDIFSIHFAGRYFELMQWLVFAFKVNFSSFFGGAGAILRGGVQLGSGSNSPKT